MRLCCRVAVRSSLSAIQVPEDSLMRAIDKGQIVPQQSDALEFEPSHVPNSMYTSLDGEAEVNTDVVPTLAYITTAEDELTLDMRRTS